MQDCGWFSDQEKAHLGNVVVEIHHSFTVENVRGGSECRGNVVVLEHERGRIAVYQAVVPQRRVSVRCLLERWEKSNVKLTP